MSLSMQPPDTPDADQLLQALPLVHLTALHLTGPWTLSARAVTALTAATALQALTLPGACLQKALAELVPSPAPRSLCSVLSGRLQRLHRSDAGGYSAATLRALSDQLTALTELWLDYNPLPDEGQHSCRHVLHSWLKHHFSGCAHVLG